MSTTEQITKKTRGRKSSITSDLDQNIVLQQHHFNYSDDFAEKLANFATTHLDDRNKEFKAAWKKWTESNAAMIQREVVTMKTAGYQGSVEEKMYFSARYYYRKKAIREQTDAETQEDKLSRKKYECIDKNVLIQMNEHIVSQICSATNCDVVNGGVISRMTPSKAFSNYCEKFDISCQDANMKKNYKNLYWRISKKSKA